MVSDTGNEVTCEVFPCPKNCMLIGLMHYGVLLISFTTTPRSHVVSARFFHISYWYSFQFLSSRNTFEF